VMLKFWNRSDVLSLLAGQAAIFAMP